MRNIPLKDPIRKDVDPTIQWPSLKPKKSLQCQTILDGQIYVIDDIFSANECQTFVEFGKGLTMEGPKPPGRGEATRTNHRFETYSTTFSDTLWSIISPHIQSIAAIQRDTPLSLYPKIRIYHYPTDSFFGPHYDDNISDPITGLTSRWTLLIYLTGEPSVQGGGTIFHVKQPRKNKPGENVKVDLKAGRVVLHKHGRDCLLHEGEKVEKGGKWVLRSDIMFGR